MAGVTNTGESNPTSGSWSQQADRIRAAPKAALSDRAQGRITGATSTTIALNASQITSDTLTVAQGGTALTEKDASGGPPKRGREWQLRAKPLLRVLPMPLPTTTLIAIVVCLLSFVPGVRASASTSDGTLLSDYKYAWSSNGGQVAFALASGVAHAKTLLKQTTVLVGESGIPSADIGL